MKRTAEEYKAEAIAFVEAHSDYHPSDENHRAIFARLNERGFDLGRDTLATVYAELKKENKLAPPSKS
jgi:hypothetical protein